MDENISAKSSFTVAEIELLPLCGVGIMVLILLVAAVVGVIRLLEMLAGDIIVASVVGITWLLEMLHGDIIAAVVGITQLLDMLAGVIMASNQLGLCMVAVALNCKNGISLDQMLVAANVCT